MIQVKEFTFNHFQTNCYVLWDEESLQCAIVDPGMEATYEDAQLEQFIEQHKLQPTLILLTHAHTDHIAGLRHTCEKYHLPVTFHVDGLPLLRQASSWGSVLGFQVDQMDDLESNLIEDNSLVTLGNETIEGRFVPGHAPGSMAYVIHNEKMVLTGDALFRGSIGRTDFPGGSYDLLIEKLQSRIFTLDENFAVLPGHGDCSSIREEILSNPFIHNN